MNLIKLRGNNYEKKIFITLVVLFISIISFACVKVHTKTNDRVNIVEKTTNPGDENCNEVKKESSVKNTKNKCFTLDFRYLELSNEKRSPTIRHIDVFLNIKDFSEETLSKLLKHLSAKNPQPEYLVVEVKTDWTQLNFPSDCPGIGASNMPADPHKYDYHTAILYRRNNKLYFKYNPILKNSTQKRVIVETETK